jgi:hypothetical protein
MLRRRTFLGEVGAAGLMFGLDPLGRLSWAGAGDTGDSGSLEQSFRVPPNSAKAWVYWWWLAGAASAAGIMACVPGRDPSAWPRHTQNPGLSGRTQ